MRGLLLLLPVLLLVGCGAPPPPPAPTPDAEATITARVLATLAAVPTPTAIPVPTAQPVPSPTVALERVHLVLGNEGFVPLFTSQSACERFFRSFTDRTAATTQAIQLADMALTPRNTPVGLIEHTLWCTSVRMPSGDSSWVLNQTIER